MRGKVDQQSMLCSCKGITPAYAGKSPLFQNVRQCIEDHPRLCGEKADTAQNLANSAGSPPPMRGKGFPYIITSTGSRITPAYAGKRIPYFAACFTISDHPRLCGEKLSRCDDLRSGVGSPPPMRGKVFSIAIIRIKTRITPAYAGKRRPCGDLAAHCRDHPRLCGEKWFCCHMTLCFLGSPPPMRGKGGLHLFAADRQGITPAYAGKSPLVS